MTTYNEPVTTRPGLLARVKGILLQPKREWEAIDREPATVGGLYAGYVAPLAAIPPLAKMIGGLAFGYGGGIPGLASFHYRPTVVAAVTEAILTYALSLAAVFLVALIIEALATTFGGQKSRIQALKITAYGGTAVWLAGIFNLVPALAVLGLLGLYSLYLYFRGLPILMKTPEDKALPYTALVVLGAIVTYFVIGLVVGIILTATGMGAASMAALGANTGAASVQIGGTTVNTGDLDRATREIERAAAQMEAAAANPGAVTVTSGDALQGLLPATLAGMPRTNLSSGSGGMAGIQASGATAEYTAGDTRIELKVSDLGSMAGLATLGGALNVQSNEDDGNHYEKVATINGRMTNEEYDRSARTGSYGFLVGGRFMVEAEGQNVSMEQLKAAAGSVNAGRLEQMARAAQ